MAGGWDTSPNFANATDMGTTTGGDTSGTIITSGAANTKGSWTQLIASTAADFSGFYVFISTLPGSGSSPMCLDLAIAAAGNEANGVVFQNLVISAAVDAYGFLIPFPTPAGSRIAVRYASTTASDTIAVQVTGFDCGYGRLCGSGVVDTYGYSGTGVPIGIAIDPGATANTKGAYTQLTASTTHDLAGFFLGFDMQNHPGGSTSVGSTIAVDIAIGASGAEKIILPNVLRTHQLFSGGGDVALPLTPIFPITIPAGTRIAARAQCQITTATDRNIGLSLYGIRE